MVTKKKLSKIISRRFSKNKISLQTDFVAVESPLELSLQLNNNDLENVAILMRTPGDDKKLIMGFLLTEGIFDMDELKNISLFEDNDKYIIKTNSNTTPELSKLKRNFISNSSCGICGKEVIDEILKIIPKSKESGCSIEPKNIVEICEKMRLGQKIFEKTGGVHAIALFSDKGEIISIEEDVGRHNAFDKAIGGAIINGNLEKEVFGACLSGRASYEMVQKAAMVGIQILICIGAPTSLAVDLAASTSITLIGFVSEKGYNIYTSEGRILSNIN